MKSSGCELGIIDYYTYTEKEKDSRKEREEEKMIKGGVSAALPTMPHISAPVAERK